MQIHDLIASVNDRLTPTERRIAAAVLHDPTQIAFGTVSDLAERAGASRPSVVRFASKLGFSGYSDLQNWVREGVSRRLSSPSHRIRHHDGSPGRIRRSIEEAVHATFDALDPDRLAALAEPIATARCVWILSGETSMAGAHTLHSGLSMIRPHVALIHEHAAGRELCGASPDDAAVIFDFARYRRHAVTAARTLAAIDVRLVAITDGPLSPLAALTKAWCELRIPAVGPFDSSLPAVLAAELLVSRVVGFLGDAARERIDQLEAIWQATDVFLTYTPRTERGRAGAQAAPSERQPAASAAQDPARPKQSHSDARNKSM